MSRRLLAVALAAVGLAGCLAPTHDAQRGTLFLWEPDDCDPTRADTASRAAPLIDALHGSPSQVMQRFAAALGIDLPPAREANRHRHSWGDTTTGPWFTYDPAAEGSPPRLAYYAPRLFHEGDADKDEAFVRGFLQRFGAPSDVVVHAEFRTAEQVWSGANVTHAIDWTAGYASGAPGTWGSFWLHGLHDLSDAEASLSAERAAEIASRFMRCKLDSQRQVQAAGYVQRSTGPGIMGVWNETMTFLVAVRFDAPDNGEDGLIGFHVRVDAATGAVRDWQRLPSD